MRLRFFARRKLLKIRCCSGCPEGLAKRVMWDVIFYAFACLLKGFFVKYTFHVLKVKKIARLFG